MKERPISITECRNCMEAMKAAPDKFWDLAIVDPPYGISIASEGVLHNNSRFQRGFNKNKTYKKVKWDSSIPDEEYFLELFRVSRFQIIWGGNFFFNYLSSQRGYIIWYKRGKDTNPNFSPCEFAWTNCEGLPKVFFFDWIGFGYINSGETKIHPTQKPIALYQWLLKNYASPGNKILDTHLGSGSSRIAAYQMGFDFWGYEIDKDYFEGQEKRFKIATPITLFDIMGKPPEVNRNRLF